MAYFKVTKKQEGGGSAEALIDHDNLIPDTFIQPSNGTEAGTGGWSATPYIEVIPDEILTFAAKSNGAYYFSWYDENKAWLNAFILSDTGYTTLTVPSTAHYVRFSNQDANMARLQAWRGL